ncbi:MAG: amidohydrolase family protein [Saprospiraceae bacterium]
MDDGRWAERLIGSERAKTSYAFKSLFGAKAKIAFGSDWFVAPPTPLEGIYAVVPRQTIDGKNPNDWVSEQKITEEQALICYTRNAAYTSFDEDQKGELIDFVIIDRDIRAIAPNK